MLVTIYRIALKIVKGVASLPPLTFVDIDCPLTKSTRCETIVASYLEVLTESEKLIVAAYWVFVVLAFSYNNYNLFFTMKYWSLSLKIESLIEYE